LIVHLACGMALNEYRVGSEFCRPGSPSRWIAERTRVCGHRRVLTFARDEDIRSLIRSASHQGTLCWREEECPCFEVRSAAIRRRRSWTAVQPVARIGRPLMSANGSGCPKNLLEEAMDTPNGALVRRCFRILNARSIGLTITLADITEKEFWVLGMIEAERQEQIRRGDGGNRNSR
jgi:hypothetical protein